MLWRHGDVLIAQTKSIPTDVMRSASTILARGEITGHSHRVEDPSSAQMWIARNGEIYLKILATTRIIHEEHHPITLEPGTYRVWQQREYTPERVRPVYD
ncbi:MAG TPA: hypothetical protein VFN35_19745 [Ktedonobacteraceae bacterium]|nr:hypothetical protein [Ktedonobacteraceae bacterium]